MFQYFLDNELAYSNRSGFKPGDPCINQLIAITHEKYKGFNDGVEMRGVFLFVTEAFDKVWHQRLIYKLRRNGFSGNSLKLLESFLE